MTFVSRRYFRSQLLSSHLFTAPVSDTPETPRVVLFVTFPRGAPLVIVPTTHAWQRQISENVLRNHVYELMNRQVMCCERNRLQSVHCMRPAMTNLNLDLGPQHMVTVF